MWLHFWVLLLFKGHYLIISQPFSYPLSAWSLPPFPIQPTINFLTKRVKFWLTKVRTHDLPNAKSKLNHQANLCFFSVWVVFQISCLAKLFVLIPWRNWIETIRLLFCSAFPFQFCLHLVQSLCIWMETFFCDA